MLVSKIKRNGFTLVELLIASVLGMLVVGGIITVFATTVRFNSDNLQMVRLNQELRGVMSLISRDLRRAGYFFLNGNNYLFGYIRWRRYGLLWLRRLHTFCL